MQPIIRYLKSNDPLFLVAYLIVYLSIVFTAETKLQQWTAFCFFAVILSLFFALRKRYEKFNAIVMNVLIFGTVLYSQLHR